MKYYIPTSSLNLDEILQSESISPFSFYAQRKTGCQSIELIDEVKSYSNHIVLFGYPVSFSIKDTARYNFPLLIEIDDEEQLKDIKGNSEGMYFYNHTIYLTPENCSFYFYREKDFELATINTKNNGKTKYYDDYKIYPSILFTQLKELRMQQSIDVLDIGENTEIMIDKQKGALFACLLGRAKSVSPELAKLQFLTQKLYDYFTSIIASLQDKKQLMPYLLDYWKEYKAIDPEYMRFESNLSNECNKYGNSKQGFIKQLEDLGKWNDICNSYMKEWDCNLISDDIDKLSTTQEFDNKRSEIENHTNKLIKDYQKQNQKSGIDMISVRNNIVEFENKAIINRVLNYILREQLTDEQLKSNRLEICNNLMHEIKKEVIGWGNSKERNYAHKLFNSIQYINVSFSLKETDNMELMAVAAFLLKGDSFNQLMTYLKMNEIEDYRYVLTLWGALYGYRQMDRDMFPDEILTKENYKNIHCKLHGCFLNIERTDESQHIGKTANLLKRLLVEPGCKGASKHENIYREHIKKFGGELSEPLIKAIKEDKRLKRQKTVFNWLDKEWKKKKNVEKENVKQQKSNTYSLMLFPEQADKNSFSWDNIDTIIQVIEADHRPVLDPKVKKQIKEDLEWVLDPKYSVNLRYEQLIENLKKRLIEGKINPRGSKGGDMTWKNELYRDLDIELIIKCIQKHFN